jgi:hypothetical protein
MMRRFCLIPALREVRRLFPLAASVSLLSRSGVPLLRRPTRVYSACKSRKAAPSESQCDNDAARSFGRFNEPGTHRVSDRTEWADFGGLLQAGAGAKAHAGALP